MSQFFLRVPFVNLYAQSVFIFCCVDLFMSQSNLKFKDLMVGNYYYLIISIVRMKLIVQIGIVKERIQHIVSRRVTEIEIESVCVCVCVWE